MRILLILVMIDLLGFAVQAQDDTVLERFAPVSGSLDSGGSQIWTFNAAEGEVLSFVLRPTSGDLDPMLTITTSNNTLLLANDDYAYPDSPDALLEAVTIPRPDTYTITVSGFGTTAGEYSLTLLAGFADQVANDTFDNARQWQSSGSPMVMNISNGRIALELAGVEESGFAVSSAQIPADFYARAEILQVGGQPVWTVGLIARQQDNDNYYAFEVNQRGEWRFVIREEGDQRSVRDWITHPAIVAGQTNFTLSLMANDTGFDFFYNDLLIGRVTDDTLTQPGKIGLMIETGTAADSRVSALFDDLVITSPLQMDGQNILPQTLLIGDAVTTVQELQRRHLIPSNGEMRLTVPESFVNSNQPGVNEILLGGSQQFENFAIGTTVSWEAQAPGPTGCGLLLRAANDSDYTLAYLDQTGGYGLSRRQGETFTTGLFAENPSMTGNSHHILVIANEDQLYYYVNGQYVGTVEDVVREGQIGNAVVNFEPITTACQFTNTWLWQWS
jgi:Bacterial pre-peptidase C-terminal domain